MVDTFNGGSFATPDELKAKLKFLGEEYTDTQLQKELETANRKLRGLVGRWYVQQHRFGLKEDTDSTPVINLHFSPIYEFDHLEINDVEESSDNYTVDTELGTLTFSDDTNVSYGALARLYYVPEIFKDLEILLAGKSILMFTYMHTEDGIKGVKSEQLSEEIKGMVNLINGKNPPSSAKDYTRVA